MENITYEGHAYTDGARKLFPLCAKNADGSVNQEETRWLIQEAAQAFLDRSVNTVPSEHLDGVLSQIVGAAQSYGIEVL
jgi:hypothetical protein